MWVFVLNLAFSTAAGKLEHIMQVRHSLLLQLANILE
jgi:hypothetical protein